ncbi:hypothetical protein IQ255_23295 [Pleurocapsales cyanobacterium LEGE 10410]|nr:hypothetical protein [Pleurocapsales cyanobacterium LEGE 10410]
MKKTIKNIKVKEIPTLINKLGLYPEQTVNFTIEDSENNLISTMMDRIGKQAQQKGLTPEKLEELLADES